MKIKEERYTLYCTNNMTTMIKLVFFLQVCATLSAAFVVQPSPCLKSVQCPVATSLLPPPTTRKHQSSSLAAIRFDAATERWVTNDPANEGPEAGYGIWGSLLRAGPKPFFSRLFTPDVYDQAVLKYIGSNKGASRIEAQPNMDNFLDNPNDWTFNRLNGKDRCLLF